MHKGKLGITYSFLAGLAFMLVFFGQYLLCALLTGLVIVVERDEWLSRQCLQAVGLMFVCLLAQALQNAVAFSQSRWTFSSGVLTLFTVLAWVIWIPAIIFTIMGWVRTAKGQEARLPLVGKWADKAFGVVQTPPPAYGQPHYPYQAPPQPPMQPPVMPQQPPPYGAVPQPAAPFQPQAPPVPEVPQQADLPPADEPQNPPPAPPTLARGVIDGTAR